VGGAVLGALVGLWAASTHKVLADAPGVLITIATAAVALLAVVLAAMALMAGFLTGFYGRVIADEGGVRSFFRPFQVVAVISAMAALIGFVGAINGTSGSSVWQETLFGLAAWFMVSAIVGTVGLVFVFVRYAARQRELAVDDSDETTH
jgi:hypothetical protein